MGQSGQQQVDPNQLLQLYGQYLMSGQGRQPQAGGYSQAPPDAPGGGLGGLGHLGDPGAGTDPGQPGMGQGLLNGQNTYNVSGNGPLETWGHNMGQGVNNHPIISAAANYATGGISGKLGQVLGHMYNPALEGQTSNIRVPGSVTNGGWGNTFGGDAGNMWNLLNPGQGVGQPTNGGLFGRLDAVPSGFEGLGSGGFSSGGAGSIYSGTANPWDWGTAAYLN